MTEMITDPTWPTILDAVAKLGQDVRDNKRICDELAALEGTRYITRLFCHAALGLVENCDPAYPHLTKFESPWIQWGLPNPDFVYWGAPLHGDHQYRISGTRGTSHAIIFETYSGFWDTIGSMTVTDNTMHDQGARGELEIGPDGEFELILGGEKLDGNWLALPDGVAALTIREVYYDWETERPSRLSIERIGATYPPPPVTAEVLRERLEVFRDLLSDFAGPMIRAAEQHYDVPPDTMQFGALPSATTGLTMIGQYYGIGQWHCAPDQAVLLEVTPPECVYWGFHLTSQHWESWDWHMRPTSINGHQAVLDADGVFRAVISHRDPGVPNWFDAGGHDFGLIAGRYTRAEHAPLPTLRTVPFDELADLMPADTPRVRPEERSEQVRRRMLSVHARNAD